MTLAGLYNTLNGISEFSGKVAYRSFPVGAAPALPFICYLIQHSDNFFADGICYMTASTVDVELYTDNKSPETELLVENALSAAGLPWQKTEDYLDDEQCYMIVYTVNIEEDNSNG